VLRDNVMTNFVVRLPREALAFPQPLAAGAEPGFAIRGIKGWNWTPDQYLSEIPVLARCKMNFLMNCYLSMFSQGLRENRWWEPLPEGTKESYAHIVRRCQEYGIAFCFAMHPQLSSPRPMDPTSAEDFELLWQHFAWAQGLGVKWFSVLLDDIHVIGETRILGLKHARMVSKLFGRLREGDPETQFVFCPTWYWGDGSGEKERAYLEALAEDLHREVYLFWTGDSVVGNITRRGAERYRGFARHRLILWDNYPVNDGHAAMHLGPVTGRDPDLCEVVDGYMSNPHASQNEVNRIPLFTCADYAWNPWGYDPVRSIGQAIVHLEDSPEARLVLRDLVQAYPGMLLHRAAQPAFNTVRDQYSRITAQRHAKFPASAFIQHVEDLARRMQEVFPKRYQAARKTLEDDIAWLRESFEATYGVW